MHFIVKLCDKKYPEEFDFSAKESDFRGINNLIRDNKNFIKMIDSQIANANQKLLQVELLFQNISLNLVNKSLEILNEEANNIISK